MNYNSDSNIIYHYTSFDKFKYILKYGTLRFKESTQSNDMLDTVGLVNALKTMPDFKSPTEMSEAINLLSGTTKEEFTASHQHLWLHVSPPYLIQECFGMRIL